MGPTMLKAFFVPLKDFYAISKVRIEWLETLCVTLEEPTTSKVLLSRLHKLKTNSKETERTCPFENHQPQNLRE
jgi:hypothetical protein